MFVTGAGVEVICPKGLFEKLEGILNTNYEKMLPHFVQP
jgi:hypothetical protein